MTPNEIARVQEYLRTAFSNNRIAIDMPGKPDAPIEVRIVDEFVGVLHRDEDEGEVSCQPDVGQFTSRGGIQ
jgi:hypothetical protein